MNKFLKIALAFAPLFLIGGLWVKAQNQRSAPGTLYYNISPTEVGNMLDSLGYEYKSDVTSKGIPQILITIGKTSFYIDFFDCKDKICESLTTYYAIDFKEDVTGDEVNKWNYDARFSRAYSDEDKDAVLESDFNFKGGASLAALQSWVQNYYKDVKAFDEFF